MSFSDAPEILSEIVQLNRRAAGPGDGDVSSAAVLKPDPETVPGWRRWSSQERAVSQIGQQGVVQRLFR